ncbi:conserved hypothetical protein, partial [delta proteobacterium NaphS2]
MFIRGICFFFAFFRINEIFGNFTRCSYLGINCITDPYNGFFCFLALFSFSKPGLYLGSLLLDDRNAFSIETNYLNAAFAFRTRRLLLS